MSSKVRSKSQGVNSDVNVVMNGMAGGEFQEFGFSKVKLELVGLG